MIRKNKVLKVPSPQFVKELRDFTGNIHYSFLYNECRKNQDTQEWEITGRYCINVMNMDLQPNTSIIITEILGCKPTVTKDKKGKEYLNCVVEVNARDVEEKRQPQINQEPSNEFGNYNNYDDLGF